MIRCSTIIMLLLLFSSGSSLAQPIDWQLHPQAKVLYESIDEPVLEYILALDKYRKTANRWSPKTFKRLKGDLTRYTLELPRDYTSEQVFAFYREQLPKSASELFFCQKRQCADSNNWANDHFKVKQLYGQDASQRYGAYEIKQEQAVSYVTIYSVRRGNRRLYVQIEVLTATP